MKFKKFLLAFALLLVIAPCAVIFAACGETPGPVKDTCVVTFIDYDDKVIDTKTIKAGESASTPANPTRDGYVFAGWDISFDNVTTDITVKATYKQAFTVKFVDYDGTELKVELLTPGQSATAPANPSRTGFKFVGWDKPYNNITGNLIVTAVYGDLILGNWKLESVKLPDFVSEENEEGIINVGDWAGEYRLTERSYSFLFTETEVVITSAIGMQAQDTLVYVNNGNGTYSIDCSESEIYSKLGNLALHFTESGRLIAEADTDNNEVQMTFVSGAPKALDKIAFTEWEFSEISMLTGPNPEDVMTMYLGDIEPEGTEIFNFDFMKFEIYDECFTMYVCGDIFSQITDWEKNVDGTYTLTSENDGYRFEFIVTLQENLLDILIEDGPSDFFPSGSTIKLTQKSNEPVDAIAKEWSNGDDYAEGNIVFTFLKNGKVSGWYNDLETIGYWTNNGNGTYTVNAYSEKNSYGQITEESDADVNLTFTLTDGVLTLSKIGEDEVSYEFDQGRKGVQITFDYNYEGGDISGQFLSYKGYLNTPYPNRDGYNFMGWSETPDGTESINIDSSYWSGSDKTFYAIWKKDDSQIEGDWEFQSLVNGEITYGIDDLYGEITLNKRYMTLSFNGNTVTVRFYNASEDRIEEEILSYYKFEDGIYKTYSSGNSSVEEFRFEREQLKVMVQGVDYYLLSQWDHTGEDQLDYSSWEFSRIEMPGEEGLMVMVLGDIMWTEIVTSRYMNFYTSYNYQGERVFLLHVYMGEGEQNFIEGKWKTDENGDIIFYREDGAENIDLLKIMSRDGESLILQCITEDGLPMPLETILEFAKKSDEPVDEIVREWSSGDDYTNGNIVFTFLKNGKVSGWYNDIATIGYWTNNGDGTYTVNAYSETATYSQITEDSVADVNLTFTLINGVLTLSKIESEDVSHEFTQGRKEFTVEFWSEGEEQMYELHTQKKYLSTANYSGETPTKAGFRFLGWKIEGTEEIVTFQEFYYVKSNLVFIAVFEEEIVGEWGNGRAYTDENYYGQNVSVDYSLTFNSDNTMSGNGSAIVIVEGTMWDFDGERYTFSLGEMGGESATAVIVDGNLRVTNGAFWYKFTRIN